MQKSFIHSKSTNFASSAKGGRREEALFRTRPTHRMDYAQEQADEIEALDSIYYGCFSGCP